MFRACGFVINIAACRAVSHLSQRLDIVSLLSPWARYFTLACFT